MRLATTVRAAGRRERPACRRRASARATTSASRSSTRWPRSTAAPAVSVAYAAAAAPFEQDPYRLEGGDRVGSQRLGVVVPLDEVDVEVACRAGECRPARRTAHGRARRSPAAARSCPGRRRSGFAARRRGGRGGTRDRAGRWFPASWPRSCRRGWRARRGSRRWRASWDRAARSAIPRTRQGRRRRRRGSDAERVTVEPRQPDPVEHVARLVGGLAYPGDLVDLDHPRGRRRWRRAPSTRTSSCRTAVATVLPARSRHVARVRVAVTRTTGSSARTSTIAASRARNGPGGRSAAKRGTASTPRWAGTAPGPDRTSSRPPHSSQLEAQTGGVDSAVERVEQRSASPCATDSNSKPNSASAATATVGSSSAGGERRWGAEHGGIQRTGVPSPYFDRDDRDRTQIRAQRDPRRRRARDG